MPRFYPPIEVKGVDPPPIASRLAYHDMEREKHILREAALVNLLHHPYICEMLEKVVDNHHHYLVFGHAQDSVQLLDYIITHGHFSERLARKVARQIGSALEYCHMNNIVHRDVKLENILISPSGKAKITDFGLSNLYDPNDHLSTFCGSSYFPAPELLNAAPYTGPEVDVWSFGVVLYTMVCGGVPWDDENPAALQAKMRRGSLKFPASLSPQCKDLLSRMLKVSREKRASLSEVTCHPWMVHGFSGPAPNHLPVRQPLDGRKLDRQVIHAMHKFDFGSDEEIERKLVDIFESDVYLRVLRQWEQRQSPGLGVVDDDNPNDDAVQLTSPLDEVVPDHGRRKTGIFEQCRKKVLSVFSASSSSDAEIYYNQEHQCDPDPTSSSSTANRNCQKPQDPTRGFHPLISVYYLTKEKMERSRQDGANDQRTSHGS